MRRSVAVVALAASGGCVGNESPAGPSVNRAPEIRSVTVTPAVVLVGGTATVKVDAIDPDGDRLFFRFTAEAGSVIPDPANPSQATYVQSGVDRPADVLSVTVTDTKNASAAASRSVALQGNRPPQVSVSGGGSCHPECSVSFTADASDPDGDPVTYAWSGCATDTGRIGHCTIVGVGVITATVVVSDGRGGIATASGTAEGVNRPPVVRGGEDFASSRARFNVYNDDPDGDPLVCGWWGNCQCTGSIQSFNLDCALPTGLTQCFERFSCTDPFGASAETTFRLIP